MTHKSILQGMSGSHFEPRPVAPPLPNKCDWEIEPTELDFATSTLIGKVWIHLQNSNECLLLEATSLLSCHLLVLRKPKKLI